MRYVILGAGAIGATIGGRLADAGFGVLLVGRGEHAAAVKRDGLLLELPGRSARLSVPMQVTAELRLAADDVLVLAVKSQDTAALLDQLAAVPVDGGGSPYDLPVFCAQNGIVNEDAALRFFERVYAMCVNVPAAHLEPGVVQAPARPVSGVLQVGRYPRGSDELAVTVAADLRRSGFGADVRADIMPWKRTKLISNLVNALQVLLTGGYAVGTRTGAAAEVVTQLAAEARACFAAAGLTTIDGPQFQAEAGGFEIAPAGGRTRQGGSTWQSVERGLPSVETDYLNGEIVRLGRLHDVPTPVNTAVQALMREVVTGTRTPRALDPGLLLAQAPATAF